MPSGLTVNNGATGSVQIDTEAYNLALVSKQTITSRATTAGGFGYTAVLTYVSSVLPVVAYSTTDQAVLGMMSVSGTTWTLTFYTKNPSQAITCFIFARPIYQGPGAGLLLYNAAGELTFDSRMKYAQVYTRISGSTLTNRTVSLPAGSFAAIQGNAGSERNITGTFPTKRVRKDTLGIGFGASVANISSVPQIDFITDLNPSIGHSETPNYEWLVINTAGM